MPHIAVAGAGIGGLAAALSLAEAGCEVSVFERAPALAEVGAGLQLSPNATAVLRRFGLLDAVARDAVALSAVRIGRGRDGAVLARLPLGDAAARFGSPFLVTLRADLHRALLEAVRARPGIRLETGMSLAGWHAADDGLSLGFEAPGGPNTPFAGLVGADGLRSAVRRQLYPGEAAPVGRRTAWRATIPAADVPDRFRDPCSNLWLGARAHLVHYPVAGGRLVNVVAAVDDTRRAAMPDDLWSKPGDPAALAARFEDWAAPLRELLAAAPTWTTWPILDRPPLARWSRGPVTLLGDAAHPMLPFLAQGAAQALEDAEALGDAMTHRGGDPAAAFGHYDSARRRRAARVQVESRRQAFVYHLSGAAALLRDLVLARTPDRKLLERYAWLYAARL